MALWASLKVDCCRVATKVDWAWRVRVVWAPRVGTVEVGVEGEGEGVGFIMTHPT